jgi:hypothetical protein
VTDQYQFTATAYAYHLGQHISFDITTQCQWLSSDTLVFMFINGTVMKKTAQGGSMYVAVKLNGLSDTVRFTMLQDLSLLTRINFQATDTVYNEFWKGDWGLPYTDSAGYGWINAPYVASWVQADDIRYNDSLFLTSTAAWSQSGPSSADSAVETDYKIKAHDGDYIIKMCLGHPYYHGRLGYIRCGANMTKKNPDGSDTLFKFQVANNYTTPLHGIRTDTVVVRGEQGIFLKLFGPIGYIVMITSAGINIDSVAYDKLPLPVSSGTEMSKAAEVTVDDITACPNPFNPEVSLRLKGGFTASMKVFSLSGKLVATLTPLKAGSGYAEYRWNASRLSSGVYVALAQTKGRTLQKRVILVK